MADHTIEQRFAVTLAKLGVTASSHLGLAVSGGVDSIVLAHLALGYARQTGVRLSAFTVDHCLRDTSAAEAAATAATLQSWGMPCDILAWHDAAAGPGLQARARDARYDLLAAAARKAGCDAMLLGHQADDQAETFFMRLGDGSGLKGLGGMREMRTDDRGFHWLRPLLGIARADIAQYAAAHGLPVIDDPSNASEHFTRVRLRGLLQDLRGEGLTPDRLSRNMEKLQEAEDALDWLVQQTWRLHASASLGALSFDMAQWHDWPRDLRRRLVQRALHCLSPRAYPAAYEQLSWLADHAGGDDFAGHALGGCLFRRRGARLWVLREPAALPPPQEITADALVWDARFDLAGLGPWAGAGARLGALGAAEVDKKLWAKAAGAAPALVRQGLPALWAGEKLLAVPSLSWRAGENLPALPQVSPLNWGADIV